MYKYCFICFTGFISLNPSTVLDSINVFLVYERKRKPDWLSDLSRDSTICGNLDSESQSTSPECVQDSLSLLNWHR